MFLLLLLVAALTALYLWRIGALPWTTMPTRRAAPEEEAKRILAERFARGDLGSEDFLERASMLNWTPGSDTVASRPRRRPRR